MNFIGAYCDIYIGKGAGKKLMNHISQAHNSVKIVSPYLSPALVNELITLHDRGIRVGLITSDDIHHCFIDRNKRQVCFLCSNYDES